MGFVVVCGQCGGEVYTTGTRFPPHRDARDPSGDLRCTHRHGAVEPVEYTQGFDSDPWVYQGGAWEMGKDA